MREQAGLARGPTEFPLGGPDVASSLAFMRIK